MRMQFDRLVSPWPSTQNITGTVEDDLHADAEARVVGDAVLRRRRPNPALRGKNLPSL